MNVKDFKHASEAVHLFSVHFTGGLLTLFQLENKVELVLQPEVNVRAAEQVQK